MKFVRPTSLFQWTLLPAMFAFTPTISGQEREKEWVHIPDTPAGRILSRWIEAHNRGDESSLREFVKRCYSPPLLEKADFEKHLGFYVDAVPMFGKLEETPYRIVANDPFTLIVELLKATVTGPDQLTAENRVLVEIDVDPAHPQHMARGLGLGSVACARRK